MHCKDPHTQLFDELVVAQRLHAGQVANKIHRQIQLPQALTPC